MFYIISNPDIIAGALNAYINYSSEYIPLMSHFWNDITICIKFPEPLARWHYLLSIYSNDILWVFTIIYTLIVIIIIYIFSGFEKKPIDIFNCALYLLGVMTKTGVPIRKYCKRHSGRCLICIGLVCGYLAVSVYEASFYNLVMIPRYPNNIKTIDEILTRKIQIATTHNIAVIISYIIFLLHIHLYNF